MTIRIYVAEIAAWDPALPGTRSLYFATHGLATAAGDTPAATYIAGRISQPASIRREIFAGSRIGGRSRVSLGSMILRNEDGGLDHLAGYAFDGRPVTIRVGDAGTAYPAGFATLFQGVMDQVEFRRREVEIRLRDRALELEVPLQDSRYAGTSTAAGGIEGTADDLKDKVKPWGRGRLFEVPPAYVNSAKLIFQAHDGAAASIDAVYVGGNAVTAGAAHASQAALESASVTPGQYDSWLAQSVFRLQTEPQKAVTCDIAIGATAADRTVAAIARHLVESRAGIATADLAIADLAALDAANAAEIGYWTDRDGVTVAEALDRVSASIGAYWWFDRQGRFRMARLAEPAGTPALTLKLPGGDAVLGEGDAALTAFEFLPVELPVWRVALGYRHIELVQRSGLAGAALSDEARAPYLAEEYRIAKAEDAAVLTAHPGARELRLDTRLVATAAAAAEAARLLALLKVERQKLRVTVRVDQGQADSIDLGRVVRLQTGRYGLAAGKDFLVIGQELDLRRNRAELILWG
ncbi:MAG: hypothetical protein RIB84_21200 [Sneathiellaceae bacterium]